MRKRLAVRLDDLRRNLSGSVAVEFALVLPLLLLLLVSGMEYTRFVLMNQKMERASAMVADLISQSQSVTMGDLNVLFSAVDRMLEPFELGVNGTVIVTSVSGRDGSPIIQWQERLGSSGNASALGTAGNEASLPYGLTLRDGENVILCELYMSYDPMLLDKVFKGNLMYRVAVFRPRFRPLETDPRST